MNSCNYTILHCGLLYQYIGDMQNEKDFYGRFNKFE